MNGIFGFWYRIPLQRRKRLALFLSGVVLVGAILWAARSVLGLYLVGFLLAYILAPVVSGVQHGIEWLAAKLHSRFVHRAARSTAIVISYILATAVVAGVMALLIPVVVKEAQQLWQARNAIWQQGSKWVKQLIELYDRLPPQVRSQIDEATRNLTTVATNAFRQAVAGTFSAISYTAGVVLAIVIVPFWTYFLLRDYDQIRDSAYRSLPRALREDVRNILRMLDFSIGAYLRGELVLMLVVGILQTLVLVGLGVEYALLLGVLAGLLEVIPSVGPTLAAVPAILIALTHSPGRALVVAVAVHLVQSVENAFIVPRVLGHSLGLHPVVMMVVLVVGTEVGGLPGLLLAPILTAILRDMYRYLGYRFSDTPYTPEEALARVLARAPFTVEL